MVQFGWRDETLAAAPAPYPRTADQSVCPPGALVRAWTRGLVVSAIAVVLARVLALAFLPARARVEHEVTEQRRVSVGHVT